MRNTFSKILLLVLTCVLALGCVVACQPKGHEHTYVDGKCTGCNITDPNYHKHLYIDGKCECGATDPNYEHTHNFVEGKCTICNAADPNFVHEHSFVEGVCTGCGITDANFGAHTHNFVEGKCTVCGITDEFFGNHTCNFQEGACTICNATDPNFHKHAFVDGKCECGLMDENFKPDYYSLQLEGDKTQATPGETVTLTTTLKATTGELVLEGLTYVIVEGGEYATIDGNKLTVKAGTADGLVIKVMTTYEGVDSNVFTVTTVPSTHVDSISLKVNSDSTAIMKGTTVGLTATVAPAGIAQSFVQFEIISGSEYAELVGTSLTVKSNAPSGAEIKIVATFGDVESNVLTLTVAATQAEINAGKYFFTISSNSLVVDKNGASAKPLYVEVYNYNMEKVTEVTPIFQVVEGTNFLKIDADGLICNLEAIGHGTAQIEVSIPGNDKSEIVDVQVILPPDQLLLPEVFAERAIDYKFSKRDNLPFAVTGISASSDYACKDVTYTFTDKNGKTENVAVYNENGTITFLKTGKITVTAKSASGSRVEPSVSYTFNINNGYNVYSYTELQILAGSEHPYNGQQEINIVILEKPVAEDGKKVYGYDLVPVVALQSEQTIDEIMKGVYVRAIDRYTGETVTKLSNARVQFVNKSLWVNGNYHKIDVSGLRVFTNEEYTEYHNRVGEKLWIPNVSGIFSAEPWISSGAGSNTGVDKQTYFVKLYNFEVVGNAGISFAPDGDPYNFAKGEFGGATRTGISIGQVDYDCHYYVDAENLTVSGCSVGVNLNGIVGNGTMSNIHVYDIHQTGIMMKGSEVYIENPKFGQCGATAIELAPEEHRKAGLGDDDIQSVTIAGEIDFSANLNNFSSNYFKNYTIQGAPVSQIVEMNMAAYPEQAVSHVRNGNGEFIFVSLIFNDFDYVMQATDPNSLFYNKSYVAYPAYQNGGITDLMTIAQSGKIDTEHQFITVDIVVPITGLGNVTVGRAVFFNHNYVPAE